MIGWLTGRRRRDPRAAVAEPRADRPRVLLVENDAHDRDRILPVLDALGVAADVAVDAEDGLRQEGRCEYAGAIIDLNLSAASRCEGFGLIARLRKRGRRYPIVITSHNRGVEYEIRGFEAGADDYMVKWPNRDEMRTRLRTLLAGAMGEAPNPRTTSGGP